MQLRRTLAWTAASIMLAGLAAACSSDSTLPSLTTSGTVVVQLSDAPFLTDSVQSVDVFVVEVDGRATATDDNDANANVDNSAVGGWTVLATPNQSYNLLSLQNGATASLGQVGLAAGTYSGFRMIIDQSKSSVTLKNGTVLSGTSNPGIKFPSAAKSGLKVNLSKPLVIVGGATTTLLVDFDVNDSFVLRGNTISQNGLLFKPVINGTIVDAATVNATVRLANATDAALDLRQGTTVASGGSNLAFGGVSSCTSVTAATPAGRGFDGNDDEFRRLRANPRRRQQLHLRCLRKRRVGELRDARQHVHADFRPGGLPRVQRDRRRDGHRRVRDPALRRARDRHCFGRRLRHRHGIRERPGRVTADSSHVDRLADRASRRRRADAHRGHELHIGHRAARERIDHLASVPRRGLLRSRCGSAGGLGVGLGMAALTRPRESTPG